MIRKRIKTNKDNKAISYENEHLSAEVIITGDQSKAKDIFTHSCLVIQDRDEFIEKSTSLGFETMRVPRKDGIGYYLFVKDNFGNKFEIK